MKKIHWLLIALVSIIFSACKISQPQNQTDLVSGIAGIEIPMTRNFNSSELSILQRICTQLKNKREFFSTLGNMEEKFKFSIVNTNCDGGVYNDLIGSATISNSNSTDLEYIFDGINFSSNIITDQTIGIKNLCDQVNSSNLSNHFSANNNIFAYSTYTSKGFDVLEMSKMIQDSKGITLKTAEKIAFFTQSSQVQSKFLGVEKLRVKNILCGPGKISTMGQEWLGPLTSF